MSTHTFLRSWFGLLACSGMALGCSVEVNEPSDGSIWNAAEDGADRETSEADAGAMEPSANEGDGASETPADDGVENEAEPGPAETESAESETQAPAPDAPVDGELPSGANPREPGPYTPVGEQIRVTVADGSRINVTLYYPQAEESFPLVLFQHGAQLPPAQYASYGEHLASWGYVFVAPAFRMGAQIVQRDQAVDLLDWIHGDGNQEALGGRFDGESVALAGHSRGGKISLLMATSDARVDAVFAIDPVDAAGGPFSRPSERNPSVTPELMPMIEAPLAIMGELRNQSGGVFGQSCAPAAENFRQYFSFAESPAIEVDFLTANHMSFVDDPRCAACRLCPRGSDDPAQTRSLTHGYMVAFLNVQLHGDASYRTWLDGESAQPEVDAGLVAINTANGF